MKYIFAIFSLTFFILLSPACKKNSTVLTAMTDSAKTVSVVSNKPTSIPTPTITYPYTDVYYGQATEGDGTVSQSSWPLTNVFVYVYHGSPNQIVISSDYFMSKYFGAQ